MLDIAPSVDNKTSIVDIMQTITAIAALIGAVISIYLQRREMADSARLNAAATLFQLFGTPAVRAKLVWTLSRKERSV